MFDPIPTMYRLLLLQPDGPLRTILSVAGGLMAWVKQRLTRDTDPVGVAFSWLARSGVVHVINISSLANSGEREKK